jgi:glycosyltransferase involved in cell wall biosynthesis
MRILFVAPYVPSAIRVRPYQWIRALARNGHSVRLAALQPPEDAWLEDVPVREWCESVRVFPLSRMRTLRNVLSVVPLDVPLQAAYSLHRQFEEFVAEEARACDVVHVEHLRGSLLARRVTGTPRVLDAVDSISALFDQTQRQAAAWQHRAMARADLGRTRRYEARLTDNFERVIVSSARDATAFQHLGSPSARPAGDIVTLPNGVDLEYFRPSPGVCDRATVLFTGKMSYHANEAAVLRLATKIMPKVWSRRFDARLVIAGKDPGPRVQQLAADRRVTVTGYVEDLRPSFSSATVVVAPLVYGTGIQNKILEAMASGVPVVASPKACEGIGAIDGRDLLVGRSDEEIAAAVVELIAQPDLRRRVASNGSRYVAIHHDWLELGRRLAAVYEDARSVTQKCA